MVTPTKTITLNRLIDAFSNTGAPSGFHFILGDYGFLNPILAAAAMAVSSLTVVFNSLRLKRFKPARFGN